MMRRDFLSSAAVAVTPAAVLPHIEDEAATSDPHRQWFEEWRSLRRRWEHESLDEDGEETAHGEALWDAADALEGRIVSTPPRTIDGAAAQIEWMLADSTDTDFQVGHREALELAVSTLKGGVA
ncbi:hypothetical protein [Salipiger mucosus]|uniref:Uncharacterized protein n=1 Tax=Salipiger mucosus DSM 16094 TaxID=1123237 RepID=S9R0I1_9RHOB|nr:hypothetical protein [Salipiger mucosus]EPX85392.1 hypothetical protein Salmuc_02772 [Salipiger mucosus DSM 16094]